MLGLTNSTLRLVGVYLVGSIGLGAYDETQSDMDFITVVAQNGDTKMMRAIHIFPNFENEHRLQELRKRYDPLYGKIGPHITLVFPFETDISTTDLEMHVRESVSGMQPFHIVMHGVTGAPGWYLFLNVKHGNDEIVRLHDTLYSGPLSTSIERSLTYVPHITVGQLSEPLEFQKAVRETQDFRDLFETTVSSVCIESISETGLSQIEAMIHLTSAHGVYGKDSVPTMRVTHESKTEDETLGK